MTTIGQESEKLRTSGNRNTRCPMCGKQLKHAMQAIQLNQKTFVNFWISDQALEMPEGAKIVYVGDTCFTKLDRYKPAN